MAIVQAVPASFKAELIQGIHDFTEGTGDTFKMALYTEIANLDASTTAYTTIGEVVGIGYTAGGQTLASVTPVLIGTVAVCDFADVSWANATLTARGALIYNSTKANRAVAVLNFGSNRSSFASEFVIGFPNPDAGNAILRVT